MIRTYRKIATIQAEQFDGSNEMADKYRIKYDEAFMGSFGIETLEGWIEIKACDWIATGVNGEHWPISDNVFRKTYAELPVIPKNVACLIKQDKERNYNLAMTFNDAYSRHIWKDGVGEWTIEHSDMFARAWLDGYQLEADK